MIIVTGGAGFIGSAVIWGLNRIGVDDTLVVDHLGTSEVWKNLRGLKFSDYLEKDAFRERVRTKHFAKDTKAIIHMGACSSTTETDSSYLIDNNFQYTKELARFAAEHGIRFIYASSAATYGDGALGYDDNESALDSLRPLNAYGYSKHLFDVWARRKGLFSEIVGLKFSNVFGPNEYHKAEMRSVPVKAFEQIRDTGAVRLFKSYKPEYADGEQKRDFLYVKDAVDIILYLLENTTVSGLFNAGSGTERSWNDLAASVFSALNREPDIEYIDMPTGLRDHYQYFTKLDMTKFRGTGYDKPCQSLEHAVADFVQNYLSGNRYLTD